MSQILQGDALAVLTTLPDDSIDCLITSPPYWGLRDYQHPDQLGQEANYQKFIANLCAVFDEVKRVLKPTGTCWVNIGDTYGGRVGGIQGSNGQFAGRQITGARRKDSEQVRESTRRPLPKSLLQLPSRFALEMSDRGWILRNEIIWHKPNCMPESVRDRFTVDHEKVFLFTKTGRYYFNQEAVLVPTSPNTHARMSQDIQSQIGSLRANGGCRPDRPMKTVGRKFDPGANNKNNPSFDAAMAIMPAKRNKRTVWTIGTRPYAGAHFATFPEKLVEPMLLAGCPEGGVVLDPFFGSGTVGVVARRLGRQYIGIEINPEYIALAEKRMAQGVLV